MCLATTLEKTRKSSIPLGQTLKTTDIHTCMHTNHKRGFVPALVQLCSKPYYTVFVHEGSEAQRTVEQQDMATFGSTGSTIAKLSNYKLPATISFQRAPHQC